ncbi:hypothetical protein ACVMB0_007538 [Bradyrhizobium sp. USDA 4451]
MASLGWPPFPLPNPGRNAGALVDDFKDTEWPGTVVGGCNFIPSSGLARLSTQI